MIEQIKRALDNVTAGPWGDNVFEPYTDVYSYNRLTEEPDGLIAKCSHEPDAHLIANSPEWLAYLIGEVERLNIAVHIDISLGNTVAAMHSEIEELQKALEQAREDFKEIVEKIENSSREEYADYERLVSRIGDIADTSISFLERSKSQ